jgi:hypothetical protein
MKTMTYANDFKEFVAANRAGNLCAIDAEMFDYWLGVLPPVFMGREVTLVTGRKVRADFGFAEGAERVTAFWSMEEPQGTVYYYAQHTTMVNRG